MPSYMRMPRTGEDVAKLVDSCWSPGAKLAVGLAAFSGLRPGQVRELAFSNLVEFSTARKQFSQIPSQIEVKLGAPALRDLFQAKMYGELYWAPVSLLVATEQPEERLRRLLSERLDLFGYSGGNYQLYLCRYSESTGTIDWWLDGKGPRLKK
jgi:hypothetical protein